VAVDRASKKIRLYLRFGVHPATFLEQSLVRRL